MCDGCQDGRENSHGGEGESRTFSTFDHPQQLTVHWVPLTTNSVGIMRFLCSKIIDNNDKLFGYRTSSSCIEVFSPRDNIIFYRPRLEMIFLDITRLKTSNKITFQLVSKN